MKRLFILSLLSMTLLGASPLSLTEKENFLKELKGSSSKFIHKSTKYSIQKGWNTLQTPLEGIDVSKTFFDSSKVELVVAYDKKSKLWATSSYADQEDDKKILLLRYLEPHVRFFVLAKTDTSIEIKSIKINNSCKKMMQDEEYNFMINSALDENPTASKDKTLSIKTRYFTHHEKGIHNETRVMLIYPKVDSKGKASFRYGPASPRVALRFAKEYEGKKFYIYDYKLQKCHEGLFPSPKIPPFPRLIEI